MAGRPRGAVFRRRRDGGRIVRRQRHRVGDLAGGGRLQSEMARGELGQPVGLGEIGPFGAQHVDRLAVLRDLVIERGELFLQPEHFLLDQIEAARRGDGQAEPEQTCGAHHDGAPVRSAARSRAERARGLAAISASLGRIAPRLRAGGRSARASRARADGGRRAARAPERARRNSFTSRSSSEWKATTARRPPAASSASAAASPRSQLADLVVDRDAQRLEGARRRIDRVAARVHDARAPARRARSWSRSASARRAATIACAMRREARSSP